MVKLFRKNSNLCDHNPESTETALLYIHDHIINAIGSQKLSCLCLLDLSAAFDTIDHNILITRLSSWFGIQGSVLNWFEYYHHRSFEWCHRWPSTTSPSPKIGFHMPRKYANGHISATGDPIHFMFGGSRVIQYTYIARIERSSLR